MTDKWNDVVLEKTKRKISNVQVPVRWRVKKGNWKFPFQLPGLSNLIVISSMLRKWLDFTLKKYFKDPNSLKKWAECFFLTYQI